MPVRNVFAIELFFDIIRCVFKHAPDFHNCFNGLQLPQKSEYSTKHANSFTIKLLSNYYHKFVVNNVKRRI